MSTFGLAKRPTPDPQASLAAAAADAHATPGDSAVLVDALWRSFNHGTNFIQISTMTPITITHLMRVFIASIGYNFVIDIATKPSDRKSTRLNSSHRTISYAVFCLKKKTKT